MTKLLNRTRTAITERLLETTFAERFAKIRKRKEAVAIELIRHRYGKDVFEKCRALPEGWLRAHKHVGLEYNMVHGSLPHYRSKVRIASGGYTDRIVPSTRLELSDYVPLPRSMDTEFTREEIGTKLYDKLYGLFEDEVSICKEYDALEQQVMAALQSYTTLDKLRKDWPLAYSFIPADMVETKIQGLPAPRIEDLNKRIKAIKQGKVVPKEPEQPEVISA